MIYSGRRKQGIALITAIAFLVITVALVGTALVVTAINLRLSRSNSQTIQTQLAAESGIDAAVARVWHGAALQALQNKQDLGDTTPVSVQDYRNVWKENYDDIGLSSPLETKVDPKDPNATGFGTPVKIEGKVNVDGTNVLYDLSIERFDVTGGETQLRLTSTGIIKDSNGNVMAQRRLSQLLSVRLPPFELEFALLSDFINCAFCHSAFISIEAAYNSAASISDGGLNASFQHLRDIVPLTDADVWQPAIAGTRRIRVAGLRNMNISNTIRNVNTLVGGTMYTRGNNASKPPSQNVMHNENCLRGNYKTTDEKCGLYLPYYQVADGVTTDIIANKKWEQAGPEPNQVAEKLLSCTEAHGDNNAGCDEKRARFYENYPRNNETVPAIDGAIPDVQSFPSPIRDRNNDRIISNAEWRQAVRDAAGRIGQLTGGAQLWLSSTNENGQPDDAGTSTFSITIPINSREMDEAGLNIDKSVINTTAQTQTISLAMHKEVTAVNLQKDNVRGYKGNLILIGTPEQPISFRGSLYVDGDVVIAGYIDPGKSGVILARRNVYVVGDVLYDCNGTAPGTGCDYTNPDSLPGFALVAAGSMIVGDPTATRHAGSFATFSTNGLANIKNNRWGTYALQGEISAFNYYQFVNFKAPDIPRYYIFRQGDTLAWRCQINNKSIQECTDFTDSITGTKLNLSNTVNPPRAGQITFGANTVTNTPARSGALSIDLSSSGFVSALAPEPKGKPTAVYMSLSPTHHWLTPLAGVIDTNNNKDFTDGDRTGYDPLYPARSTSLSSVGDVGSRNSGAILGFVPNYVDTSRPDVDATRYWDDLSGLKMTIAGVEEQPFLPARHKQVSEIRAIISESVITALWNQNGNSAASGRTLANPMPLQFDGLLYTNNALLNFQPHRGVTGGGWIVNGSIISFETGILAYGLLNNAILPAKRHCYPQSKNGIGAKTNLFTSKRDWRCVGLRVQYDKRLPRLIDIGTGEPVLTRLRSEYVPIP